MTMRKTGTILVLQGYNEYISNMMRAAQSETKLGDEAAKASKGIDQMNVKSIAAGTAIGGLLAGALQKTIGVMAGMGQEVIGVVASYERLSMSMTSLVAKEIMTAGTVDNMTDALAEASPRAEELLGWIQDLAIKSPFDQEGVAMAFRTAMAYGFTSGEAQRLTAATIDFTTATGAQSYVMDQVALALGQIKAKGKLAGQEMLQLVNAGFNVNAILKDMGYTMNDVSAGLVSADEFILKFTESIERDFGGAAARSSETLGGLLNSLGDIRSMGLRELFTPAIQAALPYLAAFAEKLQQMIPVAQMIGQYIGQFTTYIFENRAAIGNLLGALAAGVGAFLLITNATAIWGAVTATVTAIVGGLGAAIAFLLSPIGLIATAVAGLAALFVFSFTDIRAKTGDFFSGMGSDLFEFGHNMIIMLAEGMAKAMIAVINVLTQIGNVIAHWLAPGSPPRIAPDIDRWGTEAMQEFIGGMGSADFSVFNDVARTIDGYLRGMGDSLGEENVIPAILETRKALMEATQESSATGGVSENTFDRIFNSMKSVNPAMKQYIRSIFEVQAAQKKLNDITAKYDAMLAPMYGELDAIAKRRQEVVDDQRKAELSEILARARANGDSLAEELALMELREMEIKNQVAATEDQKATAVDAAQAEVDAAEEKLAVQKSLIDAQQENNRLMQEQVGLLKQLASGGGGGGGGGAGGAAGGLAGALSSLAAGMPSITSSIGDSLAGLQEKFQGFLAEITAPFAGIGEKLNGLKEAWSEAFINMGLAVSTFALDSISYLQDAWGPGGQWDGIGKNAQTIAQTVFNSDAGFTGILGKMLIVFFETVDGILNLLGVDLGDGFEEAKQLMTRVFGEGGTWPGALNFARDIFEEFSKKVQEKMEPVKTAFDDAKQFVEDLLMKLQLLKDWIVNNVLKIEIDWPEIPEWAKRNSPQMVLQTRFELLDKFFRGNVLEPQLALPEAVYPTASPAQTARPNNTIYNQNQIQGIGQVTAANNMDLATIELMIERVVTRAIGGR